MCERSRLTDAPVFAREEITYVDKHIEYSWIAHPSSGVTSRRQQRVSRGCTILPLVDMGSSG